MGSTRIGMCRQRRYLTLNLSVHGSRLSYRSLSYFTCTSRLIRHASHTRHRTFCNLFHASYARRCATDKPSGDSDLRSPGDAERALVIVRRRSNAELGALGDKVAELPGNCPVWRTDDAVSSNAVASHILRSGMYRILGTRPRSP